MAPSFLMAIGHILEIGFSNGFDAAVKKSITGRQNYFTFLTRLPIVFDAVT